VLPANAYQLQQMQWSLAGILASFVGIAILGAFIKQWLPSTPGLRLMLLEPPQPENALDDAELETLVGTEGLTTTRLAMAGKARIAGELRDVMSDGMLVEPGVAVTVIEVRGGRLIVRPVTPA
jgi:membrane-bound ClpP family serine protease